MCSYGHDLAFIHDAGYSGYALGAAPGLLRILKTHKITHGLVVDLGCGSGRWARELNDAGYDVLGIDQSRAMIALAREIAPKSRFQASSLFRVELPACDAITSVGECMNYCFDKKRSRGTLRRLFRSCYRALKPGGLLIFDVATLQRKPKSGSREHESSGTGWKITAKTTVRGSRKLRREIAAHRKTGAGWRRTREVHDLRLYAENEVADDLRRCGFCVRVVRRFGRFRLPLGIVGFIAVRQGFRGRRR